MESKSLKWILVALVAVLLFSMKGTVPKEAVADVNGLSCAVDKDCPCWGAIGTSGNNAYGIGMSKCIDCSVASNKNLTGCASSTSGLHCDMTWCYDVEPMANWARDHPWQWLKQNPLMLAAIIAIIAVVAMMPKN